MRRVLDIKSKKNQERGGAKNKRNSISFTINDGGDENVSV